MWILAVVLAATVVAVACSADDTYLPALLADPMGTYEASGVDLIYKATQGRGETPIVGGTHVARVILRYEVADEDAKDALGDAVTYARDQGWEMSEAPIPGVSDEVFRGEKDLGVGLGRMILAVDRDPEESVSPGSVTFGMTLGFDHVYEEETT